MNHPKLYKDKWAHLRDYYEMIKRMNKAPLIRACLRAATRGATANVLMRMLKKEIKDGKEYKPQKREKKAIDFDGHFNALALIQEKKIADSVRTATIATCQACALYPEASPSICRECPLPEFLRRI